MLASAQIPDAAPECPADRQAGPLNGAFLLRGKRPVFAPAPGERLTPGEITTLAARAAEAFRTGGPGLLVGAIPFDRKAQDAIWRAGAVSGDLPQQGVTLVPQAWSVRGQPDAAGYAEAVRLALTSLGADLPKIVLSRSLQLSGSAPVDLRALLSGLSRDPAVAAFITPLPPVNGQERHMVGATPELLVSRRGRLVESNPLAGSLPRARAASQEEAAAAMLSGVDKDRREHALVIEAVADALAPFCAELTVPSQPSVQATQTMWHLGTRVQGQLREDVPVAELLAALHPTPAVCGSPRDKANQLLLDLEGYDRGFYAGAVGWMDEAGDGDWYITLRCAEVCGPQLRLFAGAGIVEGSVPDCEVMETSAKFLAMLQALGVDEQGRPVKGDRA